MGVAGPSLQANYFIDWYRNAYETPPDFLFDEGDALVLDEFGLWRFNQDQLTLVRNPRRYEAIGSGAKACIAAYEALGWKNPRRAVTIACNHDPDSGRPVRSYRL